MKLLNKVTKLILAMLMTFSMGITAFAEGGYTISTAADDTHTYNVYQVLTGDLDETTGKLSNVAAGSDYNEAKGDATAAAEALADSTKTGQALATEVAGYAKLQTVYGTVSANNPLTNVAAGYYLIKDNGAEDMEGDAYSTYIVKVAKDVTIEPKRNVPSFEKKIKDTNDTTGAVTEWQDSADYDIGDVIPFELVGTVAQNYASYTTYKFTFHDVEETGLTFQRVTSVYVLNGETKTTIDSDQYTVTTNGLADGCTFEVAFSNLKNIEAVTAGSKIVVEYSSELNADAVLGNQGNVNKAKLEYSNNPNDEQGGKTGETPWDNVIVFTYKVVVNKVDQDQKALKGAAFQLEKEIKGENGAENTWTVVGTTTAGEATSFTFSGLDDGNYRLTETTTPSGYNTIDPITFTVNAEHKVEWTTEDRTTVLTSLTGSVATGEITFTPNLGEGSLTTTVVNKSGSTLPETGGIGTTIFYVVGGILMVGAGLLLVKNKKANN